MIKIRFEGLMCFYSNKGDTMTRNEVLIVDDYPDHQRRVVIDGKDVSTNFATIKFGVETDTDTNGTFRKYVTRLSEVSKDSSELDPGAAIRLLLPGGKLKVLRLAAHEGEFTLPHAGGKVKRFMAYNSLIKYPGETLDLTVDSVKYTITKEATISNLSGQVSYRSSNDPCYNHFKRYAKILASKDCDDVAAVVDGSTSTIVAEAVRTEAGTIVITSALQTQCSNTQWP